MKWEDSKMLRRAYQRGKFSLSKCNYDDLMSRLKDNNTRLSELTQQNIGLEPSRKRRRQSSKLNSIRNYARGVYKALQSSFGCGCCQNHSIILGFSTQTNEKHISGTVSDLGNIEFRVIISCSVDRADQAKTSALIWQETRIKPEEEHIKPLNTRTNHKQYSSLKSPEPHLISTVSSETTLRPTASSKQTRKRVQFLAESSSVAALAYLRSFTSQTATLSESMESITIKETPILAPWKDKALLENMCQAIASAPKLKTPDCLGYIHDGSTRFLVYPLSRCDEAEGAWTTISLNQILCKTISSAPRLTPADKVQLSAIVASAVVRLHPSPWLKPALSSKEILFYPHNSQRLHQRACVSKKLPESELSEDVAQCFKIGLIRNPTLFALGILLIEISMGAPLDQWRTADDMALGEGMWPQADFVTADRLLKNGAVLVEVGPRCRTAIWRCIELSLDSRGGVSGLEDNEFCQEVYDNVVVVLEEEARNFTL